MSEVVYICDGNACERRELPSCKSDGIDLEKCRHTTDPKHAKFGPCEDPENILSGLSNLKTVNFGRLRRT